MQDIAAKILQISCQRPRALCISSGNGTVSSVSLRQPGSSDSIFTYKVTILSVLNFKFIRTLWLLILVNQTIKIRNDKLVFCFWIHLMLTWYFISTSGSFSNNISIWIVLGIRRRQIGWTNRRLKYLTFNSRGSYTWRSHWWSINCR